MLDLQKVTSFDTVQNLFMQKPSNIAKRQPMEKTSPKTAGLLVTLTLIIGVLAMFILITVNATNVVFGVLTVKAILLMVIMSNKSLSQNFTGRG